MFRIRCTTFWFFMKTINMFLYVSVYGMYFFYLIFLNIQDIFQLNYDRFLFCARAFGVWSEEYFTAFIYTNITILWLFFLFRCDRSLFFAPNSIRTRIFLPLSAHVVISLLLSNSSYCIALWTCPIFPLTCPFFSLTPNFKTCYVLKCASWFSLDL